MSKVNFCQKNVFWPQEKVLGEFWIGFFQKNIETLLKKAVCDISVFYDFISKFVMLSSNDFNVEFERIWHAVVQYLNDWLILDCMQGNIFASLL